VPVIPKLISNCKPRSRGARHPLRLVLLALLLPTALALAHGTFHDRLANLTAKLSAQPDDSTLRYQLAALYCEHEQPTEALAELARIEASDAAGNQLPIDYLRGMCLRLAGRFAEALAALDQYIAAHPTNSAAHLQRARVQIALGQPAAALADYRTALRLAERPEPDLVQECADALAQAGLTDEAVRVLDAALLQLGAVPSLALRALDLEARSGRYDSALSRIDVLQQTAPRPEPWMAKRATLLAQAGRKEAARQAWSVLSAHLAALPNLERGSHAMSLLAEQARHALAALCA
jgi:tetratricopeptide (TPR) repeat protein